MIEIDLERLRTMGLTPVLANRAAALAASLSEDTALHLMRLIEVHRETVRVHDGRNEHGARVLPRLVHRLADEGDMLAVGDWVLVASCGATPTAAAIQSSATSTSRCS